ncbi:recombinase RecX [Heyndrickxia shackletonii]|uniref:Regulatory protein RecX n=1 Tax=Heyndrickxia shackletonii TaxID=157838 RepID=A0A0Q3WRL0_9BACI|nr:recombination regulator RecX [Heyndrickxia shackletonii]KQL50327.1 recombinase RecX [Heyndrickxia shackletonii]NEZ01611.1 recombination regulator RecX [Heyndrickxia shackletonii]
MPIITKITVQKNLSDRYNIYLDEHYAFSVDEDVLTRFQLRKGKELSELDLTEIHYEDEIRKGVNSAIQYLSFRMRSEKEVEEHLKKKEFNEEIIKEVIHALYKMNYLNDLEFAVAYVRTQMNTTKKGPEVIKLELKNKGITNDMIETAILEFKDDHVLSSAISLAEKTVKQNKKIPEKLLRQKVEQALIRKGYTKEIIKEAMTQITFEQDEDAEREILESHWSKAHRKYEHLEGFEYEQKIKQALYRKGFQIEQIERFLSEKEL